MGELKFKVAAPSAIDERVWETAYLTGIEGIPWYCRHHLDNNQFSIAREIDESGKLHIVWPTRTAGNLCLSTTSLRLSDQAYSLPVELARGTVNRLKSQTADWQRLGLKLPPEFFPLAEEALEHFLRCVTLSACPEEQANVAQAAIDQAIAASTLLGDSFSHQALQARRQNEGRLSTLFGVQLPQKISLDDFGKVLLRAFNLINVVPDLGTLEDANGQHQLQQFDEQIAWAFNQGARICVGPLVDFRSQHIPQWMILLEEGYENVVRTACEHAKKMVHRYCGKTQIWNCAAGLNSPNELDWSDEQTLRFAVSLIETVREEDNRTPVLLTIDQPWSEYLRSNPNGISPIHFADALIRADLGLSGLALDLNFADWPGGSMPRDLIDINRLVDRWSMLGLPLMISLTTPTPNRPTKDKHQSLSGVHGWNTRPESPPKPKQFIEPESIIRLLMSKPAVHAIIWNRSDPIASSERLPLGFWDRGGKALPVLAQLTQLRSTYLH